MVEVSKNRGYSPLKREQIDKFKEDWKQYRLRYFDLEGNIILNGKKTTHQNQ